MRVDSSRFCVALVTNPVSKEVHHIGAMQDTLNVLLEGYRTSIVVEAPIAPSRCFIVAQPESTSIVEGAA
jgi:hypothetical protein